MMDRKSSVTCKKLLCLSSLLIKSPRSLCRPPPFVINSRSTVSRRSNVANRNDWRGDPSKPLVLSEMTSFLSIHNHDKYLKDLSLLLSFFTFFVEYQQTADDNTLVS